VNAIVGREVFETSSLQETTLEPQEKTVDRLTRDWKGVIEMKSK
jgi:hypothetical protein